MSVQALSWALSEAAGYSDDGLVEVPPELVTVLVGLANHADEHGRHAYPSAGTLAHYARKSERQVRRDLVRLEELALIVRGDQRLVLHIDPDRRPVVWDLNLSLRRPPREVPKPRGGKRPNGVTPASPRSERPDTQGGNDLSPVTERPDTDVLQTVQEPPTRTNLLVGRVRHQGPDADAPEAPASAEVRNCELCDENGNAVVRLTTVKDGKTNTDDVGLICLHSDARNLRAVTARRAMRKALNDARTKRTTTDQPDEEPPTNV